MDAFLAAALLLVVTFFLGSIPFGVIISRVFFHKDIRSEGSGNIGTTNAMRTMGKKGGIAVFLLDFGKGLLSGYLAGFFSYLLLPGGGYDPACAVSIATMNGIAFFGCVLGHIYSPWLGFHGGKGIAVAVGALFFVFGPIPAIIELLIFAVLVIATKYVSVGSIAAALVCPFLAAYLYWGQWPAFILITIGALCVVYAHRANFERLKNGCENRIGSKKS